MSLAAVICGGGVSAMKFARMLCLELEKKDCEARIFESLPQGYPFDVLIYDADSESLTKEQLSGLYGKLMIYSSVETEEEIKAPVFVRPFPISGFTDELERLLCESGRENKLYFSEETQTVRCGQYSAKLTKTETALFGCLYKKRGEAVSREDIAASVWGKDCSEMGNRADVYVRYLREKLDEQLGLRIIFTKRGFGYGIK